MIKVPFPHEFIALGITKETLSGEQVGEVFTNWIESFCKTAPPVSFEEAARLGAFLEEMNKALIANSFFFNVSAETLYVVRRILSSARVEPIHSTQAYLLHKMLESYGREGQ